MVWFSFDLCFPKWGQHSPGGNTCRQYQTVNNEKKASLLSGTCLKDLLLREDCYYSLVCPSRNILCIQASVYTPLPPLKYGSPPCLFRLSVYPGDFSYQCTSLCPFFPLVAFQSIGRLCCHLFNQSVPFWWLLPLFTIFFVTINNAVLNADIKYIYRIKS